MKKGFTLIELLAVIVILAIIALIATPIVLNIINDSRESATIRSGEFYVDALQTKIMQENMKIGGSFSPKECIINSDGNATCDSKLLEVEVDGEKPISGVVTFDQGSITSVAINFANGLVSRNESGELSLIDSTICTAVTSSTKTTGNVPSGNFTPGDEYICKVKDDVEYNFFVLSTEGDRVSLILDRNINSDGTLADSKISSLSPQNGIYNTVEWISKVDYDLANTDGTVCAAVQGACVDEGPITVVNFLKQATNSWVNIPTIENTAIDDNNNYESFNFASRASIPTLEQLESVGLMTDKVVPTTSCSSLLWTMNYLKKEACGSTMIADMMGYWVYTTHGTNAYQGRYVASSGQVGQNTVNPSGGSSIGVRPVITVFKGNLK